MQHVGDTAGEWAPDGTTVLHVRTDQCAIGIRFGLLIGYFQVASQESDHAVAFLGDAIYVCVPAQV